jgi:hypothetical protein
MNRADFFLLVLQTLILQSAPKAGRTVEIFKAAGALPEEALGTTDPAEAAESFLAWQLAKYGGLIKAAKPEWLLDWEEGQRDRVTITRNPAADNAEWWMHAEGYLFALADDADKLPFPDYLVPLVAGRAQSLETNREGALLFRAWVQRIPGCEQEPFHFLGLEGA